MAKSCQHPLSSPEILPTSFIVKVSMLPRIDDLDGSAIGASTCPWNKKSSSLLIVGHESSDDANTSLASKDTIEFIC